MYTSSLQIKNKTLNLRDRTVVMGILNLTPDSFSGDGLKSAYNSSSIEIALRQVDKMLAAGADIIDIGGESTRPGAEVVSVEEEISRVAPVVEAIAKRLDILISIDTYKSKVAEVCLALGAAIINDVWALQADPLMGATIAKHQATVVLMHNSSDRKRLLSDSKMGNSYHAQAVENIISEIKINLLARVQVAKAAGILQEKIILDPGFGFGKSINQNLKILANFNKFTEMGYPLLSGPSRKSFIGHTLKLEVQDRLEGTMAALALSVEHGANIIRVHDVKEARRVADFVDAIKRV